MERNVRMQDRSMIGSLLRLGQNCLYFWNSWGGKQGGAAVCMKTLMILVTVAADIVKTLASKGERITFTDHFQTFFFTVGNW